MLGDISGATNIYIITGYTDMRKSVDGLCAIVMNQLKEEPNSCCSRNAGSVCARSPIVRIPYFASFGAVRLPTYRRSDAGSPQAICL